MVKCKALMGLAVYGLTKLNQSFTQLQFKNHFSCFTTIHLYKQQRMNDQPTNQPIAVVSFRITPDLLYRQAGWIQHPLHCLKNANVNLNTPTVLYVTCQSAHFAKCTVQFWNRPCTILKSLTKPGPILIIDNPNSKHDPTHNPDTNPNTNLTLFRPCTVLKSLT